MSKRNQGSGIKPTDQAPLSSTVKLTLPQATQKAIAAYQTGDRAEAERLCRLVLNVQPGYFAALNLLGIVARQTQRTQESVALLSRAVAVNPADADVHCNLGNALRDLKRYDEALARYDRALELRPDYADANNNRGNVLRYLFRYDEALASYDRSLAINPGNAGAHINRGAALRGLKRFEEAVASYDRALQINPQLAEAYGNRGNALRDLKRHDEALASFQRAIEIKPDYAEAYCYRGAVFNSLKRFEEAVASVDHALEIKADLADAHTIRGNALRSLGRYDEALASHDRAIRIKPDYAEAHSNRGTVLSDLKRYDEAVESDDRALEIKPDFADALNNRGKSLLGLKRHEEAAASFDRALEIDAAYADAYNNRGAVLSDLNRHDEAIASYERAAKANPDHSEAQMNLSMCRLLLGDFARGWEGYEWRWKSEQQVNTKRSFAQPLWLGKESLANKTILLHSEQGLGDTIQFCRYAKLVAALGAKVLLQVQAPLLSLLAHVEGVTHLLANGVSPPAFDCHCPLLSLPLAFSTDLNTIPTSIPYIHADASHVAAWRDRLGHKHRLRAGLVWSGSTGHKNDRNRTIALSQLQQLGDTVEYVSLQKDVREGDAGLLASRSDIRHFGDEISDFADTAALIELVDVVITVDTSVAHLAGAMGKPVWVLLPSNPDWRWLLHREDSPWYPTARLFRQPAIGDWAGVIDQVREAVVRQLAAQIPVPD